MVFEHCILDRYGSFLTTSDRQMDLRKVLVVTFSPFVLSVYIMSLIRMSQSHMVIPQTYVQYVSKAFDCVSHFALHCLE